MPGNDPTTLQRSSGEAATVAFVHTNASVLLDGLRALAALLVVGDHLRNMLFADYPQLPLPRRWAALPYLLTSAGHGAVVIFFVLSGYLIGGTVYRAMDRGQWRWSAYLTHRLLRLWIVLGPGLLLCVLWDMLGLRLHHAPALYGGANYNHLTAAVRPRLSLGIFMGNLCFVGGLHVPTLGSDGALWSLSFEFWYYLLFPLGLALWLRKGAGNERLWMAAALLASGAIAGWSVLGMFPVWLLGAFLARFTLPVWPARVRYGLIACYVPFFFILSKKQLLPGLGNDYVLGLATAVVLVALLAARGGAAEGSAFVRATRFLARGSFTLYVAHLPFALLLTSLAAGDRRWIPSGWHLLAGFGILLATLLYCYGVAAVTEFHTDAVRRWVEQRMGVRVAAETRARDAALAR